MPIVKLSVMGGGGVDKMGTNELLPYLKLHKDKLLSELKSGKYRPCPVRRVAIPKDNGKNVSWVFLRSSTDSYNKRSATF